MKRAVRVGLISYTDPEGLPRYALEGVEIEVHPEHVESFDRLNVLDSDDATPRPRAKKKS